MSDIQSFSDIEQLWPTRAEFARSIDAPQEVVRKWSLRGKIPSTYWVRIVRACEDINQPISYRLLAEMCDIDRKKTPSTLRRAEG